MPRLSEAEKQKSHARILDAAARLFRDRGVESTSVNDVMKAAGMTHGGFYRHFDSKEGLVSAAFRYAVDGLVEDLEASNTDASRKAAQDAYIARYLSPEHVRLRERGCALAALAGELARAAGDPRAAGAEAVERMTRLLDRPDTKNPGLGNAVMAQILGSVLLSRLVQSDADAEDLLGAGNDAVHLLRRHWPDA